MTRRSNSICFLLCLVLLAGSIGFVYFHIKRVERQRISDAEAAFLPVERLGCLILSNPVAFERYCNYIVEFPTSSRLTDSNADTLLSLNRLPSANRLEVIIRTPKVTDKSLSVLKSITVFDALDVRESSISDDGIQELRRAFPNVYVLKRDRK